MNASCFPRAGADDEIETATGSTISVEFADGEVIRGVAHYNPERNGFFLFPHDRSKNDRIFVVNSAIVSIEVEKLKEPAFAGSGILSEAKDLMRTALAL